MSTIVQEIASHRINRQSEALAAYRDIVRKIADDKPVDLDRASEAMAAANKTDKDLAKDIERYRQRKADYAKLAGVDAARAKRDAALAKNAQADERFKAAKAEHSRVAGALREEVAAADITIAAADDARGRLFRENDDPALRERDRALTAEVGELEADRRKTEAKLSVHSPTSVAARRAEVAAELAKLESSAKKWLKIPGMSSKNDDEIKALKKRLADIDRQGVKPLTDRLEAIAKRRSEIDAEWAKINAEKLKP